MDLQLTGYEPIYNFLCSPRASYMVGSTYYIDGGWLNVTT